MTELTTTDNATLLERVVVGNDLSRLSATERLRYYSKLCESLALNPLTRPFQYITLSGRLTLYATKDATEQLRKKDRVSIMRLENHRVEDVYVVTAYARDADGREDSATGAVALANLKGEALANALMKAETKAKRRVTLSICGLGMLDDTEVGSIPDAKVVAVDPQTGELPPAASQPSEEEERALLTARITQEAKKKQVSTKDRQEMAGQYLATGNMQTADLAALRDLLGALEAL